jgi:hypothetical protein
VSLQSRDIQLLGKLSEFVCKWSGKVFQAATATEDRVAKWRLHSKTRSVSRNTFPRQLQTNFESFPNSCCILRDCRLIGYFRINMWKCYLLFELPCNIATFGNYAKMRRTNISRKWYISSKLQRCKQIHLPESLFAITSIATVLFSP